MLKLIDQRIWNITTETEEQNVEKMKKYFFSKFSSGEWKNTQMRKSRAKSLGLLPGKMSKGKSMLL